jgi:hypothetical protein
MLPVFILRKQSLDRLHTSLAGSQPHPKINAHNDVAVHDGCIFWGVNQKKSNGQTVLLDSYSTWYIRQPHDYSELVLKIRQPFDFVARPSKDTSRKDEYAPPGIGKHSTGYRAIVPFQRL